MMTRVNRARMSLLLTVVAVTGGCATGGGGGRGARGEYETVPAGPRDPDLARRLTDRAMAALDAGDLADAEASLKKALSADVTFGPAHNNLGLVYFRRSDLYRAAWEFEYATRLMPHHPEPRNNLGLVFERVGRLTEAVAQFDKAKQMQPDDPQYIGNLARARVRRGDDAADVRPLLREVVEKDVRTEWVEWARARLARGAAPAAQ